MVDPLRQKLAGIVALRAEWRSHGAGTSHVRSWRIADCSMGRPALPCIQQNCCGSVIARAAGMERKRMRLRDYDYSSNGGYFVTICAHDRSSIFDDKEKEVIARELGELSRRFSGVTVDAHVTMPDHVHVILLFVECESPLPTVIQAFKSLTTASIKKHSSRQRVWQRGYYDRIIRNDGELEALREYVRNNPISAETKNRGARP